MKLCIILCYPSLPHARDHWILRDFFFGARLKSIVKLLAISQTIHIVCCEDDFFPKGKFKLFNGLFHSVYLAFPKGLFSIANLFALRYLWDVWDVCNEDKCCVVTQRAADLLGCLEMCYYWLKNSENSAHKLRLYATVLVTIYNIPRQLRSDQQKNSFELSKFMLDFKDDGKNI